MSDEYNTMSSDNYQFNWTLELTDMFVDQCYQSKEKFQNPNLKGAELWTDILEHFNSLGYPVSLTILMRKFSNMKITYGRIIKAGHQNKTKWPYFDKFEEIVQDVDIDWNKNDEPAKKNSGKRLKKQPAQIIEFLWNHESTLLLLQEYLSRLTSFQNPKSPKKKLWDEIREIFEENGYQISSDLLDRKFRSLRNRFLELQSTPNSDKMAWSYYKIFEKICGNQNHVVQPKKEIIYMESHDEMYDNANSEGNYCYSEREFVDEIEDEGAPLTKRFKIEHSEDYYEQKLEIERRKVEELTKIRQNMAEQNQIMREFLELMKQRALS